MSKLIEPSHNQPSHQIDSPEPEKLGEKKPSESAQPIKWELSDPEDPPFGEQYQKEIYNAYCRDIWSLFSRLILTPLTGFGTFGYHIAKAADVSNQKTFFNIMMGFIFSQLLTTMANIIFFIDAHDEAIRQKSLKKEFSIKESEDLQKSDYVLIALCSIILAHIIVQVVFYANIFKRANSDPNEKDLLDGKTFTYVLFFGSIILSNLLMSTFVGLSIWLYILLQGEIKIAGVNMILFYSLAQITLCINLCGYKQGRPKRKKIKSGCPFRIYSTITSAFCDILFLVDCYPKLQLLEDKNQLTYDKNAYVAILGLIWMQIVFSMPVHCINGCKAKYVKEFFLVYDILASTFMQIIIVFCSCYIYLIIQDAKLILFLQVVVAWVICSFMNWYEYQNLIAIVEKQGSFAISSQMRKAPTEQEKREIEKEERRKLQLRVEKKWSAKYGEIWASSEIVRKRVEVRRQKEYLIRKVYIKRLLGRLSDHKKEKVSLENRQATINAAVKIWESADHEEKAQLELKWETHLEILQSAVVTKLPWNQLVIKPDETGKKEIYDMEYDAGCILSDRSYHTQNVKSQRAPQVKQWSTYRSTQRTDNRT